MKERVLTGVIAGIAFIILIIIGSYPFTLVVIGLATIAMLELLKMKQIQPVSVIGIFSLLCMWVLLIPNQWFTLFITSRTKTEIFLALCLVLLTLTVLTKNSFTFDEMGFVVVASIYVGLGFHFFIETRLIENGLWFVFFILFLIWATDSGAYFAGRSFGKRKLWPEISPKKTIEGSIGGILAALFIAIIFQAIVPLFELFSTAFIMAVIVSIVGQLGDLVESALKRHYHVKDSGNILPGHGGILDRFDSLIFVMPVLYLFQLI